MLNPMLAKGMLLWLCGVLLFGDPNVGHNRRM
jgi:hypothetical protein